MVASSETGECAGTLYLLPHRRALRGEVAEARAEAAAAAGAVAALRAGDGSAELLRASKSGRRALVALARAEKALQAQLHGSGGAPPGDGAVGRGGGDGGGGGWAWMAERLGGLSSGAAALG
jgi:hypothetical protein|eukprot:COSAG01_NODE_1364_length_10563_cov_7.354931_5_plen_122_part_00